MDCRMLRQEMLSAVRDQQADEPKNIARRRIEEWHVWRLHKPLIRTPKLSVSALQFR